MTVNLRRGKHKLLWITGIHNNAPDGYDWWTGARHGIHYDPETKELVWYDDMVSSVSNVYYCEQNITVTDHKVSVPLSPFLSATCYLQVLSTDLFPLIELPDDADWRKEVGILTIGRRVKTMSLTGRDYTLADDNVSCMVFSSAAVANNKPIPGSTMVGAQTSMLCPTNGLQDVQLTCEIWDRYGQVVSTSPLPRINLRRGYVTILEGSLFSGSTSGWETTMRRW